MSESKTFGVSAPHPNYKHLGAMVAKINNRSRSNYICFLIKREAQKAGLIPPNWEPEHGLPPLKEGVQNV